MASINVLHGIYLPFIFIWSRGSDTIYNTVTKTNSKDLKGANMGDEVTPELENTYNAKKINISPKLLAEREKLINSIDATEEVRSEKPLTYRYSAIESDGKKVTSTFIAYSKVEVYTFLENEGYKVFKIETSPWIERLYGPSTFSSKKIKIKDIRALILDRRLENDKEIIKKYGLINIGKVGYIEKENKKLKIKNDIYIELDDQLDTKMTNNFLKAMFQLDYCFANVVAFDESKKSNVMISYHIYNNSWKPVSKEIMETALADIPSDLNENKIAVEESTKKY